MTADEQREEVRVVVPCEVPTLTPGAARVLLRIVRVAADRPGEPRNAEVDERREAA